MNKNRARTQRRMKERPEVQPYQKRTEPKPIKKKGFDSEIGPDWQGNTTLWNEARRPAKLQEYPLSGTEPVSIFLKKGNGWLGKRTNQERGQNVSMFSGARYLNWPTA